MAAIGKQGTTKISQSKCPRFQGNHRWTLEKVGGWLAQGQPRYAFRASFSGEVPVMAGPGDEIAAGKAGRGHLRASHADREQVIGTLKAAFVQGMLAKDELDARVGQALASRTYADLAALTTDIPPTSATTRPERPPAPARRRPLVRRPPGRAAAWASPSLPCRSTASPIRATPPAPSPDPWRSRASWWPLPPYSRHCSS